MACRHADPEMVCYLSLGTGAGERRSVYWCRRCGALGEVVYAGRSFTRWRKPLPPPKRRRAAARAAR